MHVQHFVIYAANMESTKKTPNWAVNFNKIQLYYTILYDW